MKLEELKNEIHSIFDTAKTELRDLTDAENTRIEEIKKEVEELRNLEKEKENEPQVDEVDDNTPTESDDEKETPKDDEPKEDEKPLDDDKDKNKENRNFNIKMEKKFSLVSELRNAMETGKKFNLNEVENRAYTVTDEGDDVVVTDVWNPLESLYTKNQLVNAGARVISGIKNNQQIPIMGKVSCLWDGETDAAADGSGVITKKVLSPKRVCAFYPVSLQLLAQDSIGVENAIRKEIEKALADKLESTVLGDGTGTDAADAPDALFANTAITTGNVSNFSGITTLESGVEGLGVDVNACKYIVSPSAKAALRNMAKSAKSTQLVMEGNQIDGTDAYCTAHVPSGKYIYGDFSNVVLGFWDNVEIEVVKDSTYLKNGQVVIIVNAFMDAVLLRPEALAIGTVQ